MSQPETNDKKEIMVLSHDPWPGYKKAFAVVFALSSIYLAVILFFTLPWTSS